MLLVNSRIKKRIFFLCYFIIFNFSISPKDIGKPAQKEFLPIYDILPKMARDPFIKHVAYFKDKSGLLTFNQISDLNFKPGFRLNRFVYPMFGYTKGNLWGTFIVNNNTGNEIARYLVFEVPFNDSSEIFFYRDGKWENKKITAEDSMDKREIQHRKMVYRIDLKPGEQQIFFRVWGSGSIEPAVSFVSLERLARKNYIEMFGNGIYMGIVVVMFFYNLFLFVTIRDKTYLYYILFIFSFWWGQAAMDGYLREFLFRDSAEILKFTRIIAGVGSLAFSMLFTIHFLQLKKIFPKIYRIFQVSLYLFIIPFLLYGLGGFSPAVQSLLYGILFLGFCYIAIGIVSLKKSAYAKYFLMGWVFFLVGGFAFALKMWGISIYYFTAYAMKLGSAFEVTVLSLGLAHRIRILREENRKLSLIRQEVEFAAKFQNQLFPSQNLRENGFSMAFHYIPGETISGDFLDYAVDSYGRTIFLISDVSGHGYSAGLIASMVKIAFQTTANEAKNSEEQMEKMNNMLFNNIHNNFITASNLRIDYHKKEAEFVRCGHYPLILFNRITKEINELKPTGLPLGVKPYYKFPSVKIPLESGTRFILYTDGLIEETNPLGEEFSIEQLFSEIRKNSNKNAEEFSDNLKHTIQKWNSGKKQTDDIAFIVIDIN